MSPGVSKYFSAETALRDNDASTSRGGLGPRKETHVATKKSRYDGKPIKTFAKSKESTIKPELEGASPTVNEIKYPYVYKWFNQTYIYNVPFSKIP